MKKNFGESLPDNNEGDGVIGADDFELSEGEEERQLAASEVVPARSLENEENLKKIFSEHHRALTYFCKFKMRQLGFASSEIDQVAEELVGETYLYYLRSPAMTPNSFEPWLKLRTYLFKQIGYQISHYKEEQGRGKRIAKDKLLPLKAVMNKSGDERTIEPSGRSESVGQIIPGITDLRLMIDKLGTIDPDSATLLRMRFLENGEAQDIADVLGFDVKDFRKKETKAKEQLKTMLTAKGKGRIKV